MTELISSVSNPLAKRFRALADKKNRVKEQAFVVEGMQPVWRAAESGWAIETLATSPTAMQQPVIADMAKELEQRGTRVVRMSGEIFNRLSDRDGPSGVMAIVRTETASLNHVEVAADDVWIVLHRIHNPGNLGTILRTADATGCAGVILCGDATDPFAPVAVKASMGSVFAVPIVIEPEIDNVLLWAHRKGMKTVGATGAARENHWDRTWEQPVCIVLGNEGDGLPPKVIANLDSTVRIPMAGTAESLNLSIAAAVLMYEAKRQRID